MHLEAPAALAGLNQEEHAGAASVSDIHDAVQVRVPAGRPPPHLREVGRLVIDGELQDAQPLHRALPNQRCRWRNRTVENTLYRLSLMLCPHCSVRTRKLGTRSQ